MGGYLLSTNQLSAGQLMAYLMATQTIQRSLAQISLLFGTVVRGVAAGARVFQVNLVLMMIAVNCVIPFSVPVSRYATDYDFAWRSNNS